MQFKLIANSFFFNFYKKWFNFNIVKFLTLFFVFQFFIDKEFLFLFFSLDTIFLILF